MADTSKNPVAALPAEPSKEQTQEAFDFLISLGISPTAQDLTPEQAVAKADRLRETQRKAVQVLTRGRTVSRIQEFLQQCPPGHTGQLVRNNTDDIQRYQALGYSIVSAPGVANTSPHAKGDSTLVFGDSVLMSIPTDEYKVIQRMRTEGRRNRITAGKRQFMSRQSAESVRHFSDEE